MHFCVTYLLIFEQLLVFKAMKYRNETCVQGTDLQISLCWRQGRWTGEGKGDGLPRAQSRKAPHKVYSMLKQI